MPLSRNRVKQRGEGRFGRCPVCDGSGGQQVSGAPETQYHAHCQDEQGREAHERRLTRPVPGKYHYPLRTVRLCRQD